MQRAEKERIILAIKKVLEKDSRVIFAYLFGSFVKGEAFNDIDIGIYTEENVNPFVIQAELKERISRELIKIGFKREADFFDVRVLNEAPFYVLREIMREGLLIVDKDFQLRSELAEKISFKYRECAGLLKEALSR